MGWGKLVGRSGEKEGQGIILFTTVLKVLSLVSFLPSPKITRNFLHRSEAKTDFILSFESVVKAGLEGGIFDIFPGK